MKILTVLTYYYPHWTGLTAHAVRVAEGLAARGHDVTVLTTQHDPSLPLSEVINGVHVERLPTVGRFSRGMVTPRFPISAARLIARNDVVQIHTPLPEALLVATLCRAEDTPLLMTHHGDVVMPSGVVNQLTQRVAFALLSATARQADEITSYSVDYAESSRLLRPNLHKIMTIYPPVDIVEPDPEGVAQWRRELGLEGKRLIGFAGRWVDEKGFDYLLRALPLVREAIPEAHLVFAGERHVAYEDTYEKCEPLVRSQIEHITFLGLLLDPQEMADFYGMIDVFALPSRTDMFALVQVEAMLCGTPVVATDIPGARVVVRETGFGRLVKPRNPRALSEGLIEVLQHPERFAPSVEGVRAVFNTEDTLSRYEEALQLAIAHHGGGSRSVNVAATLSEDASVVPVVGYGLSGGVEPTLSRADERTLDAILRNEADMAYRRRARAMLEYLELRDGDRVLDGGCGMGFYLMAMSRLRALEMYGLDTDRSRLAWARSENVGAVLVQGDLYELPFPDGFFDKVLLSEVLEHLPDDVSALRELARVLRPGGVLAISVPHANYPFLWDPINGLWTRIGGQPFRSGPLVGIWTNHERLYEPAELAGAVAAAGFQIEVLEEATHYCVPFEHFLVYGIGKPLLEHGLLPDNLRSSADRFSAERNAGSPLNPINLGVSVLRAVDRLNDEAGVARKDTFVNVLLKARKPK